MVRSFAAVLSDENTLVQRGMLEIMVVSFPLELK